MNHPYTYIFIRKDLSFEQQLVQASHSAHEAGYEFKTSKEISSIIMIGVKNKEELYEVGERLERHGIKYNMFFEPDFDMGHSSIATEPIKDMKTRRLMSKYPLYKIGH